MPVHSRWNSRPGRRRRGPDEVESPSPRLVRPATTFGAPSRRARHLVAVERLVRPPRSERIAGASASVTDEPTSTAAGRGTPASGRGQLGPRPGSSRGSRGPFRGAELVGQQQEPVEQGDFEPLVDRIRRGAIPPFWSALRTAVFGRYASMSGRIRPRLRTRQQRTRGRAVPTSRRPIVRSVVVS